MYLGRRRALVTPWYTFVGGDWGTRIADLKPWFFHSEAAQGVKFTTQFNRKRENRFRLSSSRKSQWGISIIRQKLSAIDLEQLWISSDGRQMVVSLIKNNNSTIDRKWRTNWFRPFQNRNYQLGGQAPMDEFAVSRRESTCFKIISAKFIINRAQLISNITRPWFVMGELGL